MGNLRPVGSGTQLLPPYIEGGRLYQRSLDVPSLPSALQCLSVMGYVTLRDVTRKNGRKAADAALLPVHESSLRLSPYRVFRGL